MTLPRFLWLGGTLQIAGLGLRTSLLPFHDTPSLSGFRGLIWARVRRSKPDPRPRGEGSGCRGGAGGNLGGFADGRLEAVGVDVDDVGRFGRSSLHD